MAIAELRPPVLDAHIGTLIATLEQFADRANASILENLRTKLEQQEVVVACCGYVSGGKSRLLNALLGEENLLPVSPLPSSANTVYLKPGNRPDLGLWYQDSHFSPQHLSDYEYFHALCQNTDIASIELYRSTPLGIGFIDTPGIDSIDSGNSLATSPALLQADLVIYVTDYNHVQSQVNFSFLKTVQARGIPYFVVVNQIDKHVGLELSLAEFRAKLVLALEQWYLQPAGIYFTSLLGNNHPDCQLDQLRESLGELVSAGSDLVVSSVIRSVRQVLHRHAEFFSAQQEALREPYLWVKDQAIEEQEAAVKVHQLETQVQTLISLAETIEIETRKELDKLLDNAPLFSFETRELAKSLLESRQPGFKAGFFAGVAKTEAEQEQRLQKLYSELLTRSEANLTWHLRKILANIPDRYNLSGEAYSEQVAQLTVEFPPELLLETIRPGALVSGEYVMNYTHDLAAAIKSVYRQSIQVWIKRAQAAAEFKTGQELAGLQERLGQFSQVLEAFNRLKELDTLNQSHLAKLLTSWEQAVAHYPEVRFRENHKLAHPNTGETKIQPVVKNVFLESNTASSGQMIRTVHPRLWEIAQQLKRGAQLVKPLPGFSFRVEALEQRAARLEQNLFTIALFGAFSAGKSSLANAMLGDTVLPVSPNPTTAAINKILPPTAQCPHGTIKVKLKNLADLTTDVLASLVMFGLTAQSLEQALLQLPAIDKLDVPLEAKPHQSFIRAVSRGQAALLKRLGEELKVDYSDFRDYVVQEEKACFVESIELYFSCPLTDLGVVLVDTPGSNSTNARHTNVAFEYIKNADAVLFVTYYNNAFCKADAQFLSQLGKVKDTFEMDKMFFLVNAADLAQTAEELALVVKHVEQNLRTCDIVRPRIFPVSSQLALLAKLFAQGGLQGEAEQLYRQRLKIEREEELPSADTVLAASGFKQFETSFCSFIEQDLISLASEAAKKEIVKFFHHIEGLLSAAKTDDSQRIDKLRYYKSLKQQLLEGLQQVSLIAEASAVGQEIDELLYYVNQRFSHRFSDLFNTCFLILAKPKEEQPKHAVQQCLKELVEGIEVELAQELRATALRVEKFVSKSLNNVLHKIQVYVDGNDPQCRLQNQHQIEQLDEPGLPVLIWDSNLFLKVTSLYRNPKDWVEGQGRARMREALLQVLQPQILAWFKTCGERYKDYWSKIFAAESAKLKQRACLEVSGYYADLAAALGNDFDINYLEHVFNELARLKDK